MLEAHLGGHQNKTHLDNGALDWLIKTFNAKSFLDIGCGPGGMVELAKSKGLLVKGIDGDHTLQRPDETNYTLHDFSKGPLIPDFEYDIGWSVEFVEHVDAKYIPNYMPCFQSCNTVVVTYAPPGWEGHHHVNLQDEDYWIQTFATNGLKHNEELTHQLRQHSTMNLGKKGKKAFVRNRGLVFTK